MEHETFFVILGLAGLLAIASILLPIAKRLNFPYTVLLAVAGSVLGGIVLAVGGEVQGLWVLGDFLNALDNLDITSEVVFFIFLPTLIFESALNINARHLLADIRPILLLAVLGLLISTFAVGLSVWAVSGVALVACLLLGAIVSATDPVAVVAIFKDLGAPKRLNILVEGESLFNDATAIVMFTILAGILIGEAEADLLSGIGNFIKVFFGGIVVGLLLAWMVMAIIGRLHNMPLIEITLTVCLAYFAFMFAEHYLHVSGVMAVVTAGLMTRVVGRTKVSPATWHALTETWEQLGFWANSLIFFLMGLLVPQLLIDFRPADLVTLPVLIVAAFAARALVLYAVLPAMNRFGLGQGVSLAFRTVMLWGGLRGAVALALALVLLEDPALPPELKKFFAVMVTGFVLFTLFVNAPTMRLLMGMLGLDRLPATDLAMRNRVMALSLSHIREGLERAAEDHRIKPEIVEEVAAEYDRRRAEIEQEMAAVGRLAEPDLLRVGLTTLANQEREFYLKRFMQGLISARVTRMLAAQADNLQDGVKSGGVDGYQKTVNETLGFGQLFQFALLLYRRFGISRLLAEQIGYRFEVLRNSQAVVRDLMGYVRDKGPSLLGEDVAKKLEALLQERYEKIWHALQGLRLQYPDYARTVQKRHLQRVGLRLEDADYDRMLAEQVISHEVHNELQRDLDKRGRVLHRQPKLDLGLKPEELVGKVAFFADLGPDQIKDIVRQLKPYLAVPGERIVRKGAQAEAMYFISDGAVEVMVESEPVQLGSGAFFGEIALLEQRPHNVDVVALGFCRLLVLSAGDFHRLLDQHPRLRAEITRVAQERLGIQVGGERAAPA